MAKFFLFLGTGLGGLLSTLHGLSIIGSSDPQTYLFAAETAVFCESDVPFDLCVWSRGDEKCVSSAGEDSDGSPCRDFPEGISRKIDSESRCGLLFKDPEMGTTDGEYNCLLGSFEDLASGSLNTDTTLISVIVASPSIVKLSHLPEDGVLHLSNATAELNTSVTCSSTGGIPSISSLTLTRNGVPIQGNSSEGLTTLRGLGPQNDGDVLLCTGDQLSPSGAPIYLNRTSQPLTLSILYPPMTVNRHSLRFMFEFIANPEPHTLTWEILDTNNRSLVYSKSESEIRLTGHNKYLASLLIDLSNVTVCDYSLIVENTEGFIKESAQTELKDLNTAEEDGEDEEDEVSSSTQWSLIVGILVAMCLLTTVGVIFFIAIRRCNYSKGVFYSAPRDATS